MSVKYMKHLSGGPVLLAGNCLNVPFFFFSGTLNFSGRLQLSKVDLTEFISCATILTAGMLLWVPDPGNY